jgi:carboxyl-terminal processing protease
LKLQGLALVGLAALVAACSGGDDPNIAPGRTETGPSELQSTPTESALSVQLRTFDRLIQALEESYVYGSLHAIDWPEIESRYRTRVLGLRQPDGFSSLVRSLIRELPIGAARWESREQRIEIQSTDSRNYEGIGTYIAFRPSPLPRVILLSVMRGSPAEAAGLRDHDSVIAVDGTPVRMDEGANVATRIRGPAGSVVMLTVQSPNAAPRQVPVTRGSVRLNGVFHQVQPRLLPNSNVGYLLFPRQSSPQMAEEVQQSLTLLGAEAPIRGIILDLRIAGFGGGWPLGQLLTIFGDGRLGTIYTASDEQQIVLQGQDVAGSQSVPLAILVGPDTEGRAEMLAAALQSSGRASLFGQRTPGAVEDNAVVQLPDGSRIFIQASSFRTAAGLEIGSGVAPNVRVGGDWDSVTVTQDAIRDAAVATLLRGPRS